MKPLFIFGIILLVIGLGGFIWRLFFVKPKDKRDSPPDDITNLELYRLLSGEIRWVIGFQTAILASLLVMILASL